MCLELARLAGFEPTTLGSAVLEYQGQFSDPEEVRGHIEAGDRDVQWSEWCIGGIRR